MYSLYVNFNLKMIKEKERIQQLVGDKTWHYFVKPVCQDEQEIELGALVVLLQEDE